MANQGTNAYLTWLKSSRRPSEPGPQSPQIAIVDLFSGCGAMSLGVCSAARNLGHRSEIALACDVDADALSVLQTNFGTRCRTATRSPVQELFPGRLGSTTTPKEAALRDKLGPVDILVAGPPCQGHSDLNNHSRRLDARNSLYARVARAAEVLRPKIVLIENVQGVANDRGRVVSRSVRTLEEAGYSTTTTRVEASQLGAPQRRIRHFLAAVLGDADLGFIESPWDRELVSVMDAIGDLVDEPSTSTSLYRTPSTCTPANRKRITYLFEHGAYDLPDSERPPCHRDKPHSYKGVYGRLRPNEPALTITSGFGSMGQGRFVHPTRRRLITPHEAARLQGIPDWFSFDSVSRRGSLQTIIGNAVIPLVAESLIERLLKQRIGSLPPRRSLDMMPALIELNIGRRGRAMLESA